MGVMNCSVFTS